MRSRPRKGKIDTCPGDLSEQADFQRKVNPHEPNRNRHQSGPIPVTAFRDRSARRRCSRRVGRFAIRTVASLRESLLAI